MTGPELSVEMQAIQEQFAAALEEQGGFFAPYTLTPTPGTPFRGDVWNANPRGHLYALALKRDETLAVQDVRLLSVRPGDEVPAERSVIPFDGGQLRVVFWLQIDSVSGENIAACAWSI